MARENKMAPKSELMTYIGVAPGNEHNFLFMRSTNAVFTAAHAVFDERNTPDNIDGDDDVDHDHGYPHHQAQDDDPKRKELQAPEEEPKEPNPPRTPSPDVPPLA
ncbi:hypothetical protein SCLCIDRAFT_25188 [Scleroderma citrinum Foug A]|uniref:Uncharacterized protein n=1 Tax=Scleroderma citrinum Foug A TaxID=1036808 RepID=A0A0C2ZKZ9_9AGAM|nr:hypothetical protein SCLCIDRAFT_25188 [Scleroderma citrinum Foug A]